MTTTTFDPTTTATSLATAYTADAQTLLTNQTTAAGSTAMALSQLQAALSSFDGTLNNLSGKNSVLSQTATFGDTSFGTATASATATPGNYSFFVQQLATASQNVYANLSGVPTAQSGTLVVNQAGGASFSVDLTAADSNNDGTLTPTEIATAINKASGNDSLVTASLVTVGGQSQMVLSSNATGASGAITLDTSGLAAGTLKSSLDGGSQLVAAQDAIVWLGAQNTGIELQQASNTYDAVGGVSITFNKAMTAGQAPVSLAVATDPTGTAANLQSLVDAYNTLGGVLNSLTSTGDASNGVNAAIFANDSGVRTLRSKIDAAIRLSVGGVSLANYGVTADSDGTLSLDQSKLTAKLATNPDGLDTLLGSTNLGASSGVLGTLDVDMNQWTNASTGQIKTRQESVTELQTSLATRQTTLDTQYNSAYSRYLTQFTQLQALQAQMSNTTSLFDALFNTDTSSN
ncbi:MAG TPA: flagellar filament capping protein FliD [Burkholderiaceae bacterium]